MKSFDTPGARFSTFAAIGEDAEGLHEWIQQRVRNHPATRDNPELQALMLEPVSKLTQAFAESLIQISRRRERSLVLILDTYEKAQAYLNQWLWQYLVEDTPLCAAPVRLIVVGRRSLQDDEGWRKLNQDRKLLREIKLDRFSKVDTEKYLRGIGIEHGGKQVKIYKATKGLPYYLDWVRKQQEQGEELDFSQGNQAIAQLLLQGLDSRRQKILQVVACCRWFDRAMIQHLLNHGGLDSQQDANETTESYLEWLKSSDFVEFSKGHYRLDDVARDVFRQSYFADDRSKFKTTNKLLADYFQQQANEVIDATIALPDSYEDEEWQKLVAQSLYYNLFGRGKDGLQQYIEHVFTAVYLREADVFMAPFVFIEAEKSDENQDLLPSATKNFFKDTSMALMFGRFFFHIPPRSYKLEFEGDADLSDEQIKKRLKKMEDSLCALLEYVDGLPDGFSKCVGLIYKSLRWHQSRERLDIVLKEAENQAEELLNCCRPNLVHSLLLNLGRSWYRIDNNNRALECCKKALELRQDNASVFILQADALNDLERYGEALESCQKAIDIDPKSFQAWFSRGNSLNDLDRYEEAFESFQKAIDLNPEDSDAWNNRGIALPCLKRYGESLESFQKVIDLNPENSGGWVNRGVTLRYLERYEESLESFQKVIDLNPENSGGWVNRGVTLRHLERYEESLESFQKAIDLNPENSNLWVNQGAAFMDIRRYEESIISLNRAFDLQNEDPEILNMQSLVLSLLKNFDEALLAIDRAIQLDPQFSHSKVISRNKLT